MGEECSNPGFEDKWTCPNCYHDFNSRASQCAACGADIVCTLEQMPVCRCRLGATDEDDDT